MDLAGVNVSISNAQVWVALLGVLFLLFFALCALIFFLPKYIESRLDGRFVKIDDHFKEVDKRFDEMEKRYDKRFQHIEFRLDRIEYNDLEHSRIQFEKTDKKIDILIKLVMGTTTKEQAAIELQEIASWYSIEINNLDKKNRERLGTDECVSL